MVYAYGFRHAAITMAVPKSDVGMASAEIAVAGQLHRKGKITRTDATTAINRASTVEWLASRM